MSDLEPVSSAARLRRTTPMPTSWSWARVRNVPGLAPLVKAPGAVRLYKTKADGRCEGAALRFSRIEKEGAANDAVRRHHDQRLCPFLRDHGLHGAGMLVKRVSDDWNCAIGGDVNRRAAATPLIRGRRRSDLEEILLQCATL